MNTFQLQPVQNRGHDGFTLTEVLVVLLIIATATGIAAVSFPNRNHHTSAEEFAVELRQNLANANNKALITGKTEAVNIDLETRIIEINRGGAQIPIPQSMTIALVVGQELISGDSRASIHFFGQGGATGARIEISDNQDRMIVIATNWLTGISTLERSKDADR